MKTETELSDEALVARFNAGDERAFVKLMERHRDHIFAATLGLLHNRADAEEITQDTFIRVHRGLARFRGDSQFKTWVYRIALNLARNRYWYYYRRRAKHHVSMQAEISRDGASAFAELLPAQAADAARQAELGEFSELVTKCMEKLVPRQREILTLRNVLNKSYDEIAAALGIEIGTVKSRIARARENLMAQVVAASGNDTKTATDFFERGLETTLANV